MSSAQYSIGSSNYEYDKRKRRKLFDCLLRISVCNKAIQNMDRVRDIFFIAVLFGAFISFSSSSPIDSSINDLESNDIVQPTVNADTAVKQLNGITSQMDASNNEMVKPTENAIASADAAVKQPEEIISPVEVPRVDMEKPIENAEASAVGTVEQPQGINSPIEAPKVELEKSTENAIASAVATVEKPQETNSTSEIPNTEIVIQPGKEEQQEKPEIEGSEDKEKLGKCIFLRI